MKRLEGVSILLVEDNKVNQLVAKELLTSEGATVEIADNGAIGVERVLSNRDKFDIVLMDIQMPVMDGYEATIRLRGHIDAAQLPIFAVTAHALEEDKQLARDVGMNAHISKPLDANHLITEILDAVKKDSAAASDAAVGAVEQPEDLNALWRAAGIDREEALSRLLNKEELLLAILLEFFNEFHDFEQSARSAYAQSGADGLKKQAHTLKGASGNLGATKLRDDARALELISQEENPDVEEGLQQVTASLNPVLDLAKSFSS